MLCYLSDNLMIKKYPKKRETINKFPHTKSILFQMACGNTVLFKIRPYEWYFSDSRRISSSTDKNIKENSQANVNHLARELDVSHECVCLNLRRLKNVSTSKKQYRQYA